MLIDPDYLFSNFAIRSTGALHLGANAGQEAEIYQRHGIRKVIWVEAEPQTYLELVKHLKKYPNHIALLACVSDQDDSEVVFHVANNNSQSSSIFELGTHRQEHPTVHYVREFTTQTVRVDTLLKNNGLTIGRDWFLNIDLQGAELLALKGMGELLWNFKWAYIEVNEKPLYEGCPLVKEVDDYLSGFGFTVAQTQMTKSGWGDRLYRRL